MDLILIHSPVHVIPSFESIGQVITELRSRGYAIKFRRETAGLHCFELSCYITPDDFTVDEYYHFEDSLNTDRERSLYAVSSMQGLKGFFVDSCFVYEDNISPEMAQKLKM
jgi:hypothetical protein